MVPRWLELGQRWRVVVSFGVVAGRGGDLEAQDFRMSTTSGV